MLRLCLVCTIDAERLINRIALNCIALKHSMRQFKDMYDFQLATVITTKRIRVFIIFVSISWIRYNDTMYRYID